MKRLRQLDIYDIILQFCKDIFIKKPSDQIKDLLPIERVLPYYRGGKPIFFKDPRTDKKYRLDISKWGGDEKSRISDLEKINNLIEDYNAYVEENNKKHDEEVFKKIPSDGKVYDAKDMGLKTHYKHIHPIYPLYPIQCQLARPVTTAESNSMSLQYRTVNNKYLYSEMLKISDITQKPAPFIIKFNKTILDYIGSQMIEAEDKGAWDENNIWYKPNSEFINWFQLNHVDLGSIKGYETDDKTKVKPDFDWKDVTIEFVKSRETDTKGQLPLIKVSTPDYEDKTPQHPSKYGLTKKNMNDANNHYETLIQFAVFGNPLNPKDLPSNEKRDSIKQRITRLNKFLQEWFKIEGKPIKYEKKVVGYHCKITVRFNENIPFYTSDTDAMKYIDDNYEVDINGTHRFRDSHPDYDID